MDKHTPGPWHGPHFASDDCSCNCGYIFSESQAGMGAICNVYFERNPDDENEPIGIARANARLISAAPDLLSALDLIERNSTRADWPADIWEAMTNAIAKARGEA